MLLALQGETHPRVTAAVQYLIEEIHTDDIEHLCWAKLALDCHADQPGVKLLNRGGRVRGCRNGRRSNYPGGPAKGKPQQLATIEGD